MSVGYLTARENEVELLTTKFYNLHIVSVEKFHCESDCHKIEGVQLRFVEIRNNASKPYSRIGTHLYLTKCSTTSSDRQRIKSCCTNRITYCTMVSDVRNVCNAVQYQSDTAVFIFISF